MTPRRRPAWAGRRATRPRTSFVDALDDRVEIAGADGHHLQRVRRLARRGARHRGRRRRRVGAATRSTRSRPGRLHARRARRAAAASPSSCPASRSRSRSPRPARSTRSSRGAPSSASRASRRCAPRRCVVRWDASAGRARGRAAAHGRARGRRRSAAGRGCPRSPTVARPRRRSSAGPTCSSSPTGRRSASTSSRPAGGRRAWTVVVGPEGGLDPERARRASARAPRLRLGPHILRAETAPDRGGCGSDRARAASRCAESGQCVADVGLV